MTYLLCQQIISQQSESYYCNNNKVLEAAISDNPKARYLVGGDALKMIERRNNATDEEFGRLVMDSVLGRVS